MGTLGQRAIMRHGFALLVVVAALPAPHAYAQPSRTHPPVSAKDIEADLREGRPVLHSDAVIKDRVDLSAIGTIDAPFRCRGCRFKKGIELRRKRTGLTPTTTTASACCARRSRNRSR